MNIFFKLSKKYDLYKNEYIYLKKMFNKYKYLYNFSY